MKITLRVLVVLLICVAAILGVRYMSAPERIQTLDKGDSSPDSFAPANTLDKGLDKGSAAMTRDRAVSIARDTVKTAMDITDDMNVSVTEESNSYVVVFSTPLPEGWRGASYAAKVIINKDTGKVEKWLVGS